MPDKFPRATRKHLPRVAALALVALASTALTQARAAEFPSAIDLSSLDGTTGFRLDGIDVGDRSGYSVASAGDVNGDGFGDLVIGAAWACGFRRIRPVIPISSRPGFRDDVAHRSDFKSPGGRAPSST